MKEELNKYNEMRMREVKLIVWGVIAFIVLIILFLTIYTIPAGYRGVVLTFGKPSAVASGEGFNLKIPLAQSVIKMDTRTQKYEASLTAASSDLQDVTTKIAINYHLSPESVPELYRTIGVDYATKVIYPLEQESNKAATAQFTAVELITKRDQVRQIMKSTLADKLAPRGIIVEDISIVDFAFSPSFSQAIEAKVTAEQNALAAKNKLAQVDYEAQQRVTQAKGEADAIAIQAQAINSQGGASYVELQRINKWNGQYPMFMGSGASPIVDMRSVTGYYATTNTSPSTYVPYTTSNYTTNSS
jgi:regulator of protease activity HflC (stomatin/prohibitin superfamily)